MITTILNEIEKQLEAEDNKVLTDGSEFDEYPTRVRTHVNNNDWYEIDKPEVINDESEFTDYTILN
jgi:hypothetical protein